MNNFCKHKTLWTFLKRTVLAFVLLNCVSMYPAWGQSVNVVRTATVNVPSPLIITEDTGDFDLIFQDSVEGSRTNIQRVRYTVQANNMTLSQLDGAVSAKISQSIDGVDIRGDVTSIRRRRGSVRLREQNRGYVTVGTTPVELVRKLNSARQRNRVLNAQVTIRWRAWATQDLAAGEYPTQLTVTLKDS